MGKFDLSAAITSNPCQARNTRQTDGIAMCRRPPSTFTAYLLCCGFLDVYPRAIIPTGSPRCQGQMAQNRAAPPRKPRLHKGISTSGLRARPMNNPRLPLALAEITAQSRIREDALSAGASPTGSSRTAGSQRTAGTASASDTVTRTTPSTAAPRGSKTSGPERPHHNDPASLPSNQKKLLDSDGIPPVQ